MRSAIVLTLAAVGAFGREACAQSLTRRLADLSDGAVQFTFASRPGVCGDGATYVRDGLGGNMRIYEGGNFSGRSHGDEDWPPCVSGPVRVVATMSSGELIRLRTYVGSRQNQRAVASRDLGDVSVDDAVSYLTRVIEQGHGRPSSDAIIPLVLADSIPPWPTFLRFARDQRLSSNIRHTVGFWLARGASARLGLADRDDDPEDDVRTQAVFALSQQPKDIAIPRLLEIARNSPHPAARAQALFWLGQSGDDRATDLFEEILRRR